MRRTFRFFVLSALFLGLFAMPSFSRDVLSLDGEWSFEAGGQTGKIKVPGIWNQQGYGPENEKVRFNFIGVGHYQRTISVPESWKDRSIFLVLTGISRYASIRLDGKPVGKEAIGCIGSHEWDLTGLLKPGKEAVLEIDVDSRQRWGVDPMLGAAQLNDYMLIVWGGIWGHASLEARSTPYLKDLFVKTSLKLTETVEAAANPAPSTDQTNSSANGLAECSAEFQLVGDSGADSARFDVYEFPQNANAQPIASQTVPLTPTNAPSRSVKLTVPNARLWSPESPSLYSARVTLLRAGQAIDSLETRFGIREIRFEGMKVFLNGQQVFLRGYGDDHIYPNEYSMPCDRETHVRRLKLIKQFGFNYVRHHSTILPQEYYDACDEVGMLVNAEFLLGYPQQLPGWGQLWKDGNSENLPPEVGNELLIERFGTVIREYRNHPCVFAWVFGNELNMGPPWLEMPLRKQAFQTAKTLDPTRPFMDLDGDWRNAIEKEGRDTSDFYSVLFDEWANPVTNTAKFDLKDLGKPAIAHEMGNYLTFSRPDQIELFEGTAFKPFWMVNGKAKLEELGLLSEVEGWARASERLYCFLHKSGIETLRKNPRLSGYHWWLIQDYWTTSNGLVDLFFRPKSVTPEEVRHFNAPTVLLIDGLNRSYRGGETLNLTFSASNFSTEKLNGELRLTFEFPDKKETQTFPVKDAEIGAVTALAKLSLPVPALTSPELLKISAEYVPNGTGKPSQQNAWSTRLFPEKIVESADLTHVFADETIRKAFPNWNFQPIPECVPSESAHAVPPLPAEAVYVISWMAPNVLDAVKRGANCVFLDQPDCLSALRITYKQTWWKAGDSETQNVTGTYAYEDPLTQGVITDHWCDGTWCELLDGALKFRTEQAPCVPQTVIRALPSLVLVQDTPILFRVRVGQGVLTVSGLNHESTPTQPLNEWLIHEMLRPVQEKELLPVWPAEFVLPKMNVPEGMTSGFHRLISASEEAVGPAYYAPGTVMFVSRQTAAGNAVTWRTAQTSTPDEAATTFLFAGGLGWLEQPSEGFELLVNERPVLRFDLPPANAKSARWQSEDGSVALRFEVKKIESNGQDFLGRFFLTVPNSQLEAGAVRVTVRSLGSESRRWFALNPLRSF